MRTINLSVNITYRCNTVCAHCNRGIGALNWRSVPDMTLEQAEKIVAAIRERSDTLRVKKLKLMGGEPTLHARLPELVDLFLSVASKVWVVTNNLKPDLPPLPNGARYKRMVLNEKDHHAFFVSPHDLGIEHEMKDIRHCTAMVLCGRGVEPEGFMQCSVARTLLHALGKDPAPYISDEPVLEPSMDICRHCPLSLGTKRNKRLSWAVSAGEVECPTPSFTSLARDYKILERADAHVRRAAALELCHIMPSDDMHTRIDKVPR